MNAVPIAKHRLSRLYLRLRDHCETTTTSLSGSSKWQTQAYNSDKQHQPTGIEMEKDNKSAVENFKTQEVDTTEQIEEAPKKRRFEDLPPAAQRALKEAEERRTEIDAAQKEMPKELNGRGGLDPARYSDWEVKGITSDF
jgi:hypothetical protein